MRSPVPPSRPIVTVPVDSRRVSSVVSRLKSPVELLPSPMVCAVVFGWSVMPPLAVRLALMVRSWAATDSVSAFSAPLNVVVPFPAD